MIDTIIQGAANLVPPNLGLPDNRHRKSSALPNSQKQDPSPSQARLPLSTAVAHFRQRGPNESAFHKAHFYQLAVEYHDRRGVELRHDQSATSVRPQQPTTMPSRSPPPGLPEPVRRRQQRDSDGEDKRGRSRSRTQPSNGRTASRDKSAKKRAAATTGGSMQQAVPPPAFVSAAPLLQHAPASKRNKSPPAALSVTVPPAQPAHSRQASLDVALSTTAPVAPMITPDSGVDSDTDSPRSPPVRESGPNLSLPDTASLQRSRNSSPTSSSRQSPPAEERPSAFGGWMSAMTNFIGSVVSMVPDEEGDSYFDSTGDDSDAQPEDRTRSAISYIIGSPLSPLYLSTTSLAQESPQPARSATAEFRQQTREFAAAAYADPGRHSFRPRSYTSPSRTAPASPAGARSPSWRVNLALASPTSRPFAAAPRLSSSIPKQPVSEPVTPPLQREDRERNEQQQPDPLDSLGAILAEMHAQLEELKAEYDEDIAGQLAMGLRIGRCEQLVTDLKLADLALSEQLLCMSALADR